MRLQDGRRGEQTSGTTCTSSSQTIAASNSGDCDPFEIVQLAFVLSFDDFGALMSMLRLLRGSAPRSTGSRASSAVEVRERSAEIGSMPHRRCTITIIALAFDTSASRSRPLRLPKALYSEGCASSLLGCGRSREFLLLVLSPKATLRPQSSSCYSCIQIRNRAFVTRELLGVDWRTWELVVIHGDIQKVMYTLFR